MGDGFTKADSRKVTRADVRVTGRIYCAVGGHRVPVDSIVRHKPRPECKTCNERRKRNMRARAEFLLKRGAT